ncbi:glycoside hydrolase family 15 protein [Haloarcula rubripromontorii]|uniref:glycoside hydrolase family 15 protein n=1 Tax=Haloarcula rubripromontorii TaxID=1705562 RepID=UPI00345C2CDA
MRLSTALNEYKRTRHERFPEERRTVSGSFSGHGDRLVHVGEDGTLQDYSDSLSGLSGIDRSRLGVMLGDETRWFSDLETIRQHYYRETRLVETEYDAGSFTVHQYDLTLGRAHVTHVAMRGAVPQNAKLVAFVTLAPENSDGGVGSLIHEDAGPDNSRVLEVYHRREHDYLASSTGLDAVAGQRPERLAEILSDSPVEFPRSEPVERRDQTRLTGDFLVTAPLDRSGRSKDTTLVSQLSNHDEVDRETALLDLADCVTEHTTSDDLRQAGRERTRIDVAESMTRSDSIRMDLRVLDLLSSPTGGRIAAPEFDPFYSNSGGYGYVWFRDDASVSRHLLEAGDRLDIDTVEMLLESAAFLCDSQLSDGRWPHRVWADTGDIAPGWANARVEHNAESPEYQADQTATVTAFLATLLRTHRSKMDAELTATVRGTIEAAVDTLIEDIAANDLPEPCQNVWEDSIGQFTHTTATFIEAFAAVGRAPMPESVCERSLAAADRLLDGLDTLWDEDLSVYVIGLTNGTPDHRIDAAGLHLADALQEYDSVESTTLSDQHLTRLADHVSTTLDTLFRNPTDSRVAGLARYEGDRWRTGHQDSEKVWTVTTAMGALAAARVGDMLNDRDERGDAYLDRASDLYELLEGDGPLTTDAGYLAEQAFDDGDLDSATPLGWSHALRLHATARLGELNALPTTSAGTEGPSERPTWTTGEKYGVGTVADHDEQDPSRVWFTLTEGALTEARYPQVDLMNLRTLDFLVRCTDETDYAVRTHRENRRTDDSVRRRVEPVDDEALLYRHVFTETGDGRGHEWTLTVDYATDPEHDAIVADVSFSADDGKTYDVFSVADIALTSTVTEDRAIRYGQPGSYHLVGRNPRAYTDETDNDLLVDENGDAYSVAVAMAAAGRFDWATVGAAGSDRLDGLYSDGELPDPVEALDGTNLVLIGRLDSGTKVSDTVALGFARQADTAAALGEADGALDRGYETVRAEYADSWAEFLSDKQLPDSVADDEALANQYRTALMTLLAVEDKTYHGASIASPSVPWGEAVHAEEPKGYGYNFVWSRDLYQVFTVFDAIGSLDIATEQLEYIYEYQQDEAGFIPQNTYVNGTTRWGGEQMDNISFPQVMAYRLAEAGVDFEDTEYSYENVRRSAEYVVRHGPETAQERWEEEAGFSPSSIAAEIAGLACAAKLALDTGHKADALVWLALADQWANNVEAWTATETGTERHTNTPYYTRITLDGNAEMGHLRTLANDGPTLDERNIIDGGFLELVRLGIKPDDDETIRNSVVEVDDTISVDTKYAPGFYRYNGDGYGERARTDQGAPWTVEHKGKGRLWPLLTGERAEYELHRDDPDLPPENCLRMLQDVANSGRMIAEQIWDRGHATDYDWEFAQGTGSATPLAWSMAQYVRLAHGISAGEPVETPAFVDDRYRKRRAHTPDRSPALRVDTQFRGNELVVSGETTGVCVVVKTPADITYISVDDREFEVAVDVDPGENQVIVAAADDEDLVTAGTTVWQLNL